MIEERDKKEYSETMRHAERNTMRAERARKRKCGPKHLDRELNNIIELKRDNMLV